ncbi:bifunctional oligoribonuclease/PAP phosphatase NrnA [Bacillota bacterium]
MNLENIAMMLNSANTILIFPHIQMDGDAMGSAAALCGVLRKEGKRADILIEDKIPENLKFLNKDYCRQEAETVEPDVCIALDCSDPERVGKRFDIFKTGKKTAMIDHHTTALAFAETNYIDINASATGEIVMKLIKAMNLSIGSETAEELFAAIVTDTGRFMYSNTSGATHIAAAELYETGMDHNRVAIEIYQKKRIEKVRLMNAIMSTMEIFAEGKGIIAVMLKQMLDETGAYSEETEGMVEELRSIEGVEIAVFLKEEKDGVKVTMRSKTFADVSAIAASFGGGGHKKAAGCTINSGIDDVKALITEAVKSELNRQESY